MRSMLSAALLAATLVVPAVVEAEEPFTRTQDIVYGRKYGTALTLDVFRPNKNPNGAAIVLIVSGGYYSSHDAISPLFIRPMIARGYTVFTVVHGSQPLFTVPEIIDDVHRAVRFIRHHAKEYGVDPERLGVTGASAGGHLSLILGTDGKPGDPKATDPVERESSRVKAVACFFPPTDFLSYGTTGHAIIRAKEHALPFRAAFDYREIDKTTLMWVPVTDEKRLLEITRNISPRSHVTADDVPVLIYHGDADMVVPLQQSQVMVESLKAAGVEAKLVVKPGAGHGWLTMLQDIEAFNDWFDAHLKAAAPPR